jgi:hypothetical protein
MNTKSAGAPLFAAVVASFGFAVAAPLRVQVETLPPSSLPLKLSGELAAAMGGDAKQTFSVHGPHQPCLSQTVTDSNAVQHLYWLPQETGLYEISASGAAEQAGTIARVESGKIFITTGAFSATHDPGNAGGLPSAITVAGTKAPLLLDYADRLYRKDTGEFFLSRNPAPQIKLIANGPLLAIVEVSTGYYSSPAKPAPAQPQARYRFTYFRNSPFVQVNVVVSQAEAFVWKELHVLELRAKTKASAGGPVPQQWAGGEPALEGAVTHIASTHLFSRWAALGFAEATLAVMNPHATSDGTMQARVYDGPGLLYVMGPWVEFASPRVEFERYLYIGPGSMTRPQLAELAGQLDRLQLPRVLLPELEEQVARHKPQAGIDTSPEQIRQLWRSNHALADLHALRNTAAARKVLEQAPATTPRTKAVTAEKISLGSSGEAVVTGQLLLALDGKGRLTSFYQAATDTELLSRPCSMFRFVARDQSGVEATLTAHEADRVSSEFKNGELRLRYSGRLCEATAEVELVLRPASSSIFWRGEARLSGAGSACWRLDFPVLDGVGRREGDDHADTVIEPDGWGRLLPRPTATRYLGRYPGGGATMQFIGYSRDHTTLGVIALDGRCFAKDLVAHGSEDTRTLALEVRHYPEEMGHVRTCRWPYEVETVALPGDWFALAQYYRAWATQQAWCEGGRNRRRPDSPDWFRKLVWWHHDGTRDGTALTNTFEHLRKAVPYPMAFHWYNWHSIPFDNFYPDYFPVNAYVPAVRAKLREWKVPVMPYINGHLWDTQAQSYTNENAVRWAMKKADGSLYIEHWNKHNHSTVCPFTAAWHDKMVSITDRLFREVGVDAVYLDQIGAVHAQLCYDATHGHPRGGGDYYVAGYWKLLQAVRANARRINPSAALTTEDTAEPFIRYLDGTLMCNRACPDSIPFFPAVYHDHIAQFGLYIHEPEIKAGVTYRSKEAMLFQSGAQLGWHGTDWKTTPEHQEKFRWLAQLAAYRQLGLDWLAYGDMLAPPRVTMRVGSLPPRIAETWIQFKREFATEQPAATASAWQAADGRIALFVINVSDQPLQVDLELPALAKGKKVSERQPMAKDLFSMDVRDNQLRLDLVPRSIRMFVAP